jgi:hypothetical protein
MLRVTARSSFVLFTSGLCAAGLLYGGCSDDSAGTTDTDAADGATVLETDAGTDTADAHVCPDQPFFCSETADAGGDAGAAGTVPIHLRCTALYSCWSDKTVAPDHRAYQPAFVLWSDGAEKTRWLHLPAGTTINTGGGSVDAGPDEWVFPVGTMVYKEFKLAGKRIETRRLWKASDKEWVFSVWRWSSDESTATLMNTGEFLPNPAEPGHVYEIPANTACVKCHSGHDDMLLSVDAWSLGAPGAQGITLTQLKDEGRLSNWPFGTNFTIPQDGTGKFDKVVGWYYNNCGFCHKPKHSGALGTAGADGGPPPGLELYLPVAAALANASSGGAIGLDPTETPVYRTAVNVDHKNTTLFPAGSFKRITPGNANASVLPSRDSLRNPDGGFEPGQMPPLMSHAIDDAGVELTRDWINALP